MNLRLKGGQSDPRQDMRHVDTIWPLWNLFDVTPDGRFMADGDGPKEVNGYFLVRTPEGDAPNPLWQFDGNVDLLATPTKG